MAGEGGFRPDEIDTSRPHPARMYDYYLGGRDNYEVDREAAQRVMDMAPQTRLNAEANRAFLGRAVRAAVAEGITQILDLGTGIPTSPNTHELARRAAPGTRVIYVDNDPIVATYAGARLTNTPDTAFVWGDVRDPETILTHPTVTELVDLDRPVALCMLAVLHFVTEAEDPAGIVRTLADALAPGSLLILSHGTADAYEPCPTDPSAVAAREGVVEVYRNATATLNLRSRAAVEALFGPFELLPPGVVRVPLWRPEGAPPGPEEVGLIGGYAGVGRKN